MTLTVGTDASVVASSAGGTRVYALELLNALTRIRPDWRFVLYLRQPGEAAELGDLAAAPNVETRVVAGRPNAWRIQARLPAQLDRDAVGVYHSLGYFLPLRWKGPKVVTIHDLNVFATARNWLRGPTFLPWLDLVVQTRFAIRRAARVIAVSRSARDQIVHYMHLPSEQIAVIPHGADPYFGGKPEQADLERVRQMTAGKPFVLCVGILSPQKNLEGLIRSFAASHLPHSGLRLVLAGSDHEAYATHLRAFAGQAGVVENLDILGFVPKPVLRALYHEALCLVLASHGEGFGLPLVEAMSAGTPIIAANRQAIPEVLGEAGVLIDPDDTASIAQALDRLLDEPAWREELACKARAGAGRFSWVRAAEATAAVYEEVVARSRR